MVSDFIGEIIFVAEILQGGRNRVFLLRLDNEKEVVARLPLPETGPPHLLTASEVATLDFVRNVMKIPAPKVLAWSSRAESTPVGAEFIILEKVDGVPLASVPSWRDGEGREWHYFKKLLIQMVRTDEKYAKHRFAKYGSLFYREDVIGYPHTLKIFEDESEENEVTRKFAIGPSMSSHLWRDERKLLDVDRGPCMPFTPLLLSPLMSCIREHARRIRFGPHSLPTRMASQICKTSCS